MVTSNLLDHTPLFADLSTAEKEELAACLEPYSCSKGATLVEAGQTSSSLYLLTTGFVSLTAPDGQRLATLGPGSLVGELALFRRMPCDATIAAVSDLEAIALSDERLRTFLHHHPAVAIHLRSKLGGLPVQMQDYLEQRMTSSRSLSGLPAQVRQALAKEMELHELKAGELILQTGKNPSGLFLLDSGAVTLTAPGHLAPSRAKRRLLPGDLMGTLPLLAGRPSTYDGVADQDCLVWLLPAQAFHRLSGQYPGLRRILARTERVPLSESEQQTVQSHLAKLPVFASLSPAMLRRVAAVMCLQYVAAGERVYAVGQSCNCFYLVADGEIALSAEAIGGSFKEVARVGPTEYFGERGLIPGQSYREDASTRCHTTLWILDRADLEDLFGTFPDLARTLTQTASDYIRTHNADPVLDALRQMDLFAELAEEELQHIAASLHPKEFAASTQIYALASPCDAVYLLQSGQVRTHPAVGSGRLVVSGEAFGLRALLHNAPHDASAVAETDVEALMLPKAEFSALIRQYPNLASTLTRVLSRQLAIKADTRVASLNVAESDYDATFETGTITLWEAAGEWFAKQTLLGKLRTGLLAFIVLWGLSIGSLMALQNIRGNGSATASASGLDIRSAIRAVQSMGSYELAYQDQELAQALAMADRLAPPTPLPTLPPTATPTPLPTATPTNTPLPTSTPTATNPPPVAVRQVVQQAAPPPTEPESQVAAAPARAWDGRLDRLGVVVEEANVPSGQPYWRLVEAIWQDEQESAGKHHIYVEVLDENGVRVVGQPVTAFWADGSFTAATEDKKPPDYAFNYQMYATGNAYHVRVEGLPSDIVHGIGMGSLELPDWAIHTSFMLTFKRTIK